MFLAAASSQLATAATGAVAVSAHPLHVWLMFVVNLAVIANSTELHKCARFADCCRFLKPPAWFFRFLFLRVFFFFQHIGFASCFHQPCVFLLRDIDDSMFSLFLCTVFGRDRGYRMRHACGAFDSAVFKSGAAASGFCFVLCNSEILSKQAIPFGAGHVSFTAWPQENGFFKKYKVL